MGKDNLDQQQPSEPIQIKPELVDFLYIDSERVDSFISQIKNGTLRSVSKTNATLQGSSSNAGVEANIKILKGSIGAKEQIDNSISSTENYDPFHKQVIDLINILEYDEINPNESNEAKLGFVTGRVVIRNLSIFTKLVPVLFRHKTVFGSIDKEAKNNINAMSDLIKESPSTIDLSITTLDGSKILGSIIEEYLKVPMGSILKNYGTTLPGNWVVIGIFDTTTPQLNSDVDTDTETETTVESLVDSYSDTLKNFFAASTTKVIPLVIFRTINI
mgnify:CR=1 FL=1|jgi:hypothetical protein